MPIALVIIRAKTLAWGRSPFFPYLRLTMKMLVQMIDFSSKVVHYLVVLVMISMILTSMIRVHRLAMRVGHVTNPSSLKVYKLVPLLGPHRF